MKGSSAVLERPAESPLAASGHVQVALSPDEVELVKAGLATLLQIYTRHERYAGGIAALLAKLGGAGTSSSG
ncbi:MAG: hypothetical protein HY671_08275 [Chloroflexi bacterium]|nr:hypothetical protein [Chloroflexota bacterium]